MIGAIDDLDEWANFARFDSSRSEVQLSDVDCRTSQIFFGSIELVKAKASGEIGGTVTWGGSDGPEFSGYAQGEIQDRHGNYARGSIEYDSKDEEPGKVGFSLGHEKEDSH